jgi:hypothetical protein
MHMQQCYGQQDEGIAAPHCAYLQMASGQRPLRHGSRAYGVWRSAGVPSPPALHLLNPAIAIAYPLPLPTHWLLFY